MTDDERLLEIATRLMAGSFGTGVIPLGSEDCLDYAEHLLAAWRERTREERGQDVVGYALHAAYTAAMDNGEAAHIGRTLWGLIVDHQRARAAGKGE